MKNSKKNFIFYVVFIALSTNISNANFSRDSSGLVTDNSTGLIWQDIDIQENRGTWEDSLNYCQELTLGGKNDWRLPNIKELRSILDREKEGNGKLNSTFVNTVEGTLYWSSTTGASDSSRAWLVVFPTGSDAWRSKSENFYVRCVRGGQ